MSTRWSPFFNSSDGGAARASIGKERQESAKKNFLIMLPPLDQDSENEATAHFGNLAGRSSLTQEG